MRLLIQKDYASVSRWIASYIKERINAYTGNAFVLGLPTGSSPLGIYKELINEYKAGNLSFERVVTFNMDEYVGLDKEHPQSYCRFMQDNFFSHINIDSKNVHMLNGAAEDLLKECNDYEERISSCGVELFLGGVGSDGHIAFNEPGSSLSSRTRVVALTQKTRLDNARFFNGDINLVPTRAITVGVETLMRSKEILIIASGRTKAHALKAAFEGGVSHMCTASCLQMHPNAIIVCDEDAASELKYGTVRYFKEMEGLN